MAENKFVRDGKNFTMTIKVNAKREVFGEYTVKADTIEELRELNAQIKQLFEQTIA